MRARLQTVGRWLRGRDVGADAQDAAVHTRVLMVCMGNICRSPTAEAVLRGKLAQAGLAPHVVVDSAGTHGYHTGEGPDPRAVAAAARRGYDLSALRARPVDSTDFERFDYVLAMDQANLEWLRRKAPPTAPAQLGLLLTHARRFGELEVPDPYYGPPAGFDRVLDLVEDACDGLIALCRSRMPRPAPPPIPPASAKD
jgi:protein-tyrosine phosphatase